MRGARVRGAPGGVEHAAAQAPPLLALARGTAAWPCATRLVQVAPAACARPLRCLWKLSATAPHQPHELPTFCNTTKPETALR